MSLRKSSDGSERRGVQSVNRAINILQVLASESSGLGIVDIGKRIGLPVSSVHRIITTLVDRQVVSQDIHTGHYKVGVGSFEIGSAFLRQVRIGEVARTRMEELSRVTRETVNLALRDGNHATYVDQVQSDRELQVMPRPGARLPLYCTGVGKVFLAGLQTDERLRLLSSIDLKPRTVHTQTSVAQIIEEITRIQASGFAVNDQELHLGVRCVAAPIINHEGITCAAISVTGSPTHLFGDHLELVISKLCQITAEISEHLGYRAIE